MLDAFVDEPLFVRRAQVYLDSLTGDETVFTLDTMGKVWAMTQQLDRTYGVNHYQIESIAHRTNRTLRAGRAAS